MKSNIIYITVSSLCVYIVPSIAFANTIVNTQTNNECGLNKIEVIVGGKAGNAKVQDEQISKCFISTFTDPIKSKSAHLLKLDKSLKPDRSINNLAVKVNLYDTNRSADRNNILNSELLKAISQKNDLLKKKVDGQSVDELQFNRIEADIGALQREIARH